MKHMMPLMAPDYWQTSIYWRVYNVIIFRIIPLYEQESKYANSRMKNTCLCMGRQIHE